jgi:hypothetical protein
VIPTIANAHLINQPRLGLRSIFWVWRLCSGSLSGSAESILAFTIQRTYSPAGVLVPPGQGFAGVSSLGSSIGAASNVVAENASIEFSRNMRALYRPTH